MYKLASCAEYRVVAGKFGVSKTTVHRYVYLFCSAISEKKAQFIQWYSHDDGKRIAEEIEANHGYPQAIGAIDGSHIPVTGPADGMSDYICRKGWPSIVLQAVVDNHFLFRDIYCNTPGSAHDVTVYLRSPLYDFLDRRIPNNDKVLNGVTVPLHILGDPAYPISPYIMKGFTGRNLTAKQESFNAYLSSARMCVEIAFGRLKSRWRVLCKKNDLHIMSVPKLITTCCALHNFCEKRRAPPPPAEPEDLAHVQSPTVPDLTTNEESGAIREAIMEYLAATQPLRKQFHR